MGLGKVVTLVRVGGSLTATAMGSARLVTGVPRERVEPVHDATVDDANVVLSWNCGADLRTQPLRRVAGIRILTTVDTVYVLLVSALVAESRSTRAGWRKRTGTTAHAIVRLDQDLARRALQTDHRIPPNDSCRPA